MFAWKITSRNRFSNIFFLAFCMNIFRGNWFSESKISGKYGKTKNNWCPLSPEIDFKAPHVICMRLIFGHGNLTLHLGVLKHLPNNSNRKTETKNWEVCDCHFTPNTVKMEEAPNFFIFHIYITHILFISFGHFVCKWTYREFISIVVVVDDDSSENPRWHLVFYFHCNENKFVKIVNSRMRNEQKIN